MAPAKSGQERPNWGRQWRISVLVQQAPWQRHRSGCPPDAGITVRAGNLLLLPLLEGSFPTSPPPVSLHSPGISSCRRNDEVDKDGLQRCSHLLAAHKSRHRARLSGTAAPPGHPVAFIARSLGSLPLSRTSKDPTCTTLTGL